MLCDGTKVRLFLPSPTLSLCMNAGSMRLYVAYVYEALREKLACVIFHDYLTRPDLFETAVASLEEERKIVVYGVAMFLGNKKNSLRLMKEIRQKDPGGKIVAFGPFAAVFSRRLIEQGLADIVILSDAEFVLPVICSGRMAVSKIPNIVYYDQLRIVQSGHQDFDMLDSLPFAGTYFNEKKYAVTPVITARGCLSGCAFCDRPFLWGNGVRVRSVENVCREIDMLMRGYSRGRIIFDDANFILSKHRAMALCRGFLQLPGRFSWSCSTRVDCADANLFLLMRQAGCEMICFGIESADRDVLARLGKRYARKAIVDAVLWARAAGLKVAIFLIVGNPGETIQTLKDTKRLLLEIAPFSKLNINPLVVLPGTPL